MKSDEVLIQVSTKEEIVKDVAYEVYSRLEKLIKNTLEMSNSEKYINQTELMTYLDVSRPTINKWIKDGIIRPHYLGTVKRYKLSEIENAFHIE
jgi:predicted DNA-binding transcriptional regulator AlpA